MFKCWPTEYQRREDLAVITTLCHSYWKYRSMITYMYLHISQLVSGVSGYHCWIKTTGLLCMCVCVCVYVCVYVFICVCMFGGSFVQSLSGCPFLLPLLATLKILDILSWWQKAHVVAVMAHDTGDQYRQNSALDTLVWGLFTLTQLPCSGKVWRALNLAILDKTPYFKS